VRASPGSFKGLRGGETRRHSSRAVDPNPQVGLALVDRALNHSIDPTPLKPTSRETGRSGVSSFSGSVAPTCMSCWGPVRNKTNARPASWTLTDLRWVLRIFRSAGAGICLANHEGARSERSCRRNKPVIAAGMFGGRVHLTPLGAMIAHTRTPVVGQPIGPGAVKTDYPGRPRGDAV